MAKKPKNRPVVLFLHIGWALTYDGDPDDLPQGKFGYIKDGNEDMGEALNFKPFRGTCYGYAPHHKMDLTRLGAAPDAEEIDGILIIWTATNPDGSGRFVVGWYKDALVFSATREVRPNAERAGVIARARSSDCQVVSKDERTFSIPYQKKGWPGTASAFFASEALTPKEIDLIVSYVDGTPSNGFLAEVRTIKKGGGGGWPEKPDLAQNEKVEKAAEAVVIAHYRKKGWKVQEVQEEWYGWDMTMTQGARELFVEVKGRTESGAVQLSANEYRAMCGEQFRMKYRLAIVFHALSAPELTIFSYLPAKELWVSDEGDVLKLKPAGVSAIF